MVISDDWSGYAGDLQRMMDSDYKRHKKEVTGLESKIAQWKQIATYNADCAEAFKAQIAALQARVAELEEG